MSCQNFLFRHPLVLLSKLLHSCQCTIYNSPWVTCPLNLSIFAVWSLFVMPNLPNKYQIPSLATRLSACSFFSRQTQVCLSKFDHTEPYKASDLERKSTALGLGATKHFLGIPQSMTWDLVKFRVRRLAHSFLAFHNLISMPYLLSNTYVVFYFM